MRSHSRISHDRKKKRQIAKELGTLSFLDTLSFPDNDEQPNQLDPTIRTGRDITPTHRTYFILNEAKYLAWLRAFVKDRTQPNWKSSVSIGGGHDGSLWGVGGARCGYYR